MRAALALRGLMENLGTKLGTKPQLCVGIATGTVAIGDEFAVGAAIEQTVIGEALILRRAPAKLSQNQVRS